MAEIQKFWLFEKFYGCYSIIILIITLLVFGLWQAAAGMV